MDEEKAPVGAITFKELALAPRSRPVKYHGFDFRGGGKPAWLADHVEWDVLALSPEFHLIVVIGAVGVSALAAGKNAHTLLGMGEVHDHPPRRAGADGPNIASGVDGEFRADDRAAVTAQFRLAGQ